jgi:UDP-N-acetylmuramyl pentapeptide phosphotransferase/UDP-N-acetylglucosamine-1-phosphate transferase
MEILTISLLAALVATVALVRLAPVLLHRAADHDFSGPQKFHSRAVPRVGGLAVVIGVMAGLLWLEWRNPGQNKMVWLLMVCAVPTWAFGLWEDFTKSISPRRRLAATVASALLAVWLLGLHISRTDIPGVDWLIVWYPASVALTVLVVTGVANAVNIIDGFNGLASMCVIIMLAAVALVAHRVGDEAVFAAALIVIGATAGFFLLNYPAGLIFLGDGGAYLLGFVLSALGIALVEANPQVSPLFPLLLCGYPIFETLFSIYRRKVVRGLPSAAPDGIHLHTLIYRRVMRHALGEHHSIERRKTIRNSMTSPYLWMLCLTTMVPATVWWDSTPILAGWLAAFVVLYVSLYWSIVKFRTPRWMVLRRHPMEQATTVVRSGG